MASKYKKDSLYHTNRKEYYRQKDLAAKSNNLDKSDIQSRDFEQMIGFCGGNDSSDLQFSRMADSKYGTSTALTKRYPNLAGGDCVYKNLGGYITIRDAVWLCQRAWTEFQLFRNTIEAMVEFSVSDIKLSTPNKSAKTFCKTWLKSIGIDSFADQF